ncbi:MAG TPA: UvrD-helicase domain-containing protein, partial [Patescibacteria group bacterium]
MNNKNFTNLINTLNAAQKKAVDAIEGPVMVIAGPGTGKTQILTLRIANILLKTQVNPENILALTYTESGVHAMRKRLVEIIGTPAYRVNIYTFHGFCNDLIKNNPEEFSHIISSNNASEIDQIEIIEKFINSRTLEYIKPLGDPMYYVKPILKAIEELKKEGINEEEFESAVLQEEKDFWKIADLYHTKGKYEGKMKGEYDKKLTKIKKNKELIEAYKEYQKALIEKKLYDFTDMLLEVIKVFVQNKQFLLRLQEQYQYFLIDEHQDTNAAQNKIVELLCNFYDNPNLFVVGDEKQAIYKFQGASLENFLYFKNIYPDAILINLEDNYRSTQTILDASGSLISNNSASILLSKNSANLLSRSKYAEERIKIVATNDYYSEFYYVVEEIKKKIKEGTTPREIAVLVKENKDLIAIMTVLDQMSISYINESTQDILQDLEIQKIILLFKVIFEFGNDENLIKAMHIDNLKINPLDIYKLVELSREKKTSLWKILSTDNYLNELDLSSGKKIREFFNCILQWKILSQNDRFDVLFKHVLDESGFTKAILGKSNAMQILEKVTTLFDEVKSKMEINPLFSLEDFINYIDLTSQHKIRIKKSTDITREDSIRLMTAHKSKGLEFDIVFLINVYDGHWGNSKKKGSNFLLPWEYLQRTVTSSQDDPNEDERRLFYVGLTRARKEVYISYSFSGQDGKNQVPSQFINEIVDKYKEIVDVEKFEKDFLNRKELILSPFSKRPVESEYLANKDYFAELFMRKGFAPTHLNNYLKCPWNYFFNNLIQLPSPLEKSNIYGSAIHKALSDYLIYKDKNKDEITFLLNSFFNELKKKPLSELEFEE